MTKFYNEMEQSFHKLKQDHPEVAKAIEESDDVEYMTKEGIWRGTNIPPADGEIYRAPIQTEAKKFLEKWGGKKIWQEGMWRHTHYLVTDVMDHNRVYIKDQDRKGGHIVIRSSDNWQLWESPIKLDTRRVAGWWCTWEELDEMQYVREVSKDGKSLVLNTKCYASKLRSNAVFSKDPMKPLDQWQTLEQICGGES
jgi:hypothetical protein